MSLTLYGIPNCDTVKKARSWLEAAGVVYHFQDVRRQPLSEAQLNRWLEALGWDRLINRRGTTWRQLPPEAREPMDVTRAAALLLAHPTVMKRPVLEGDGMLLVGFAPEDYVQRLTARAA